MDLFLPMLFDDDLLMPNNPWGHRAQSRGAYPSLRYFYHPQTHAGHQLQKREPLEWKEEGDQYVLEVKASGFQKDHFKLSLDSEQGYLRVMANTHDKSEEGVVTSKQFTKAFALPDRCKLAELKSEYKDGVLKVMVPKAEPPKREAHPLESTFEIIPKLLGGDLFKGQEIHDTEDSFEVKMSLSGFKPEQLNVEVSPEGVLTIAGKMEEKNEDGTTRNREICKSFALPKNCKVDEVGSKFSKDGQLTVTAPKDSAKTVKGHRKLQIQSE